MSQVWAVVDVGCHECGVESVPVGVFTNPELAQAAADARNAETGGWRDDGQTYCQVFEMPVIA